MTSDFHFLTDSNFRKKFEHGYPVASTVELAYNNTDLGRAIEAYKFFYPTMGVEAQMQSTVSALGNNGPNQIGIKVAAGPRHQIFTAQSDTPYSLGVLDLKVGGPMVIELPPGNFIGLVNDHNMRWVLDMGINGPDKGQGGKHLVLPPDYKGNIPTGYYVGWSVTWKDLFAIRVLPPEGNTTKALQVMDSVKIYPLAKAGQPVTFHFVDVTDKSLSNPLLQWENKLDYWKQLKAVFDAETTPQDFRSMFGMLQSLGIEKGIPFNPDGRMISILKEAAIKANAEMRVNSYANRLPQRLVWTDRNWEWIPLRQFNATTKDIGTESFLDLQAMDNVYFQAIGAGASMGKREPGAGSIYFAAFRDNTGAYLDGDKIYKLTVPGPVPANLFWSVTVYDATTRCEIVTDQHKAAIRSLFEKPKPNPDGSLDLYFGPKAPLGKENQWVKTIPDEGWFTYFRIYGPQAPAFNGAWKLNNIVEVK
jgi:hypothetical protein